MTDGATSRAVAFGFDFDHTLGIDHGLERRALGELGTELGRPLNLDDAALRGRLDALLDAFRSGRTSMDAMIARFAADFNVKGASAQRWRERCFALVDPLVRPIDGAPELVASLRARGIATAVLTNGWTPLQQKKIARALGA
ncbi:MAG: haloacid dehalogenase-like hydrolase, partial [Candidatus Eremiobacteraeota bacterium]|nr:haloacid dehalogenase-like hydrolase [Candidatus Eremiobacteraeota bacterium]